MKPLLSITLTAFVALGLLTACQKKPQPEAETTAAAPHPAIPPAAGENAGGKRMYGSVVETFDAGGFTYMHLDNGKEQFWAAGPLTKLQPGQMIAIVAQMPMKNFHSKNLDRDFDLIYFTDQVITDAPGQDKDTAGTGKSATPMASMNPHANIAGMPAQPATGIERAEGGKTIAEILADKQQLDGKTVKVRGKVVKYTSGVLGHNWIHIVDSSTGTDLTLTTDGTAALDDIIVAEGTLGLDKDYGYGYIYEVILENAGIRKE